MRKLGCYLLLLALLMTLGACQQKKTAEELDAGDTPPPNPEEEAALAQALAQEDTTEVNWNQEVLAGVPAYAGSGEVIEWAANDEQAVVSLRDVTRDDVENYGKHLEESSFTGELTVIGGVDRYSGDYLREDGRVQMNLLFTAQTNEIEYSTLIITVVKM